MSLPVVGRSPVERRAVAGERTSAMVTERTYWQNRPISRRRLVAAGSAGLTVAGVAACGGKGRPSAPSAASPGGQTGTQAQSGPVQRGGTLNVYYNMNAPLDLQRASGSPHQILA